MLILSRREAESICLGDNIVLTIVALGNDRVRIGVQAPPGVRILRSELEVERDTIPLQLFPFGTAEQQESSSSRKAA